LDDTVIGVGWGLSPHASSVKSKFTFQQILPNFHQNVSRKLLEIWKSDLLIC